MLEKKSDISNKTKVLYIVSTLKISGPVNQLYNVIYSNINNMDVTIITLSPEVTDSKADEFVKLGVNVISLNMSRLKGLFYSKSLLNSYIQDLKPDLVHTQGIRADTLLSKINLDIPWFVTAHNYPLEDYPMKFGWFRGKLMSYAHFSVFKKCKNLISCSDSIHEQLKKHDIKSYSIPNGIGALDYEPEFDSNSDLKFVTVGSLISRKNMRYIISTFNDHPFRELYILGDGPEMDELKSLVTSNNIKLVGNVDNVSDYLRSCDVFISASLSEGLPNTVLEALSNGLTCYLSDIEAHKQIAKYSNRAIYTFNLCDDFKVLSRLIDESENLVNFDAFTEGVNLSKNTFSASMMAERYFLRYKEVL